MAGPTLDDLKNYAVNRPGQYERIKQGLYDTAVYAAAGSTGIAFFATPAGQGNSAQQGNAGNVKTLADTNMTLAGQLPAGQSFFAESIEADFTPGSSAAAATFALVPVIVFAVAASAGTVFAAANDVNAFYQTGLLTFTVGSKNYMQEGPLQKFPPMTGVNVAGGVTTNSATVGQTLLNIARAEGKPCYIDPVAMMSGQNFNVTLSWPVAVALPSGFNGSVQVTLGGYLFRTSQ